MKQHGSFLKISSVVIILILLMLASQYLTADWSMEKYVQNDINAALKNNDDSKLLRISSDNQVFKALKAQKNVIIHFRTDNQGSGDMAYFPATIGPKSKIYGVSIKINSVLHHRYTLEQIIDLSTVPN